MAYRFLALMIVPFVLVGSVGCGSQQHQGARGVRIGEPLPHAEFTTGRGERVSLADLRGNPAVINFWATWCAPCREEIPVLQAAYAVYAAEGVQFLAVTDELPTTVRPFVEQMNMTLPVWYDPGGRAGARYAIQSIPTTFFLDADGRLAARHVGALTRHQLEAYLRRLLDVEIPAVTPPAPTPLPTPGSTDRIGQRLPEP